MTSVPRPRAAASGHDAGRHDPSAVAEAELSSAVAEAEPAFARVPAFSDAVFRDDAACLAYLERLRWPNGFICPRCESGRAWRIRGGQWKCAGCGLKTSVTAGAIFEKTRTPLTTWFAAVWYVTNQMQGVSALGLQRVLGMAATKRRGLGFTSCVGPWSGRGGTDCRARWRLMRPTWAARRRVRLGASSSRSRSWSSPPRELAAGPGRIRMLRVPNVSQVALTAFVKETVEPGSTVITDTWSGYNRLAAVGYRREVVNLSVSDEPGQVDGSPDTSLV